MLTKIAKKKFIIVTAISLLVGFVFLTRNSQSNLTTILPTTPKESISGSIVDIGPKSIRLKNLVTNEEKEFMLDTDIAVRNWNQNQKRFDQGQFSDLSVGDFVVVNLVDLSDENRILSLTIAGGFE